jgi:ornithine cyclodeaminase/alanine dehydrogenase-like protein (mu-crystallin family)
MSRVLILGHDDVVKALPAEQCETAMAEVLAARARGEAFNPLRSVLRAEDGSGLLGLMPSWRGPQGNGTAAAFGLKAVTIMPGNPARGLDAHQGIVTLFDGEIGVPTAILDGSAMTAIRTAAVTAVATRLLARQDATVLAILGAGVQCRTHLRSLAPTRSFSETRIYAPTRAHVQEVIDELAQHAQIADSAEAAVRGADVVVIATSAKQPVIDHAWLDPGTHVNSVGASVRTAWELDIATVAASSYFCDARESVLNEAGEFAKAKEDGAISGDDHIRAEIGEILAGQATGRSSDDELTVFRSLGIAVEDLAAAQLAVANARTQGLGTEVEL